jgi:tryptophanyl-tRNA synthetase
VLPHPNLLGIYRAITGKPTQAVEADFATARGYGDLTGAVGAPVVAALTPIRERHAALMGDPEELDGLLAQGAARARANAGPKLDAMKRRMGLRLPG